VTLVLKDASSSHNTSVSVVSVSRVRYRRRVRRAWLSLLVIAAALVVRVSAGEPRAPLVLLLDDGPRAGLIDALKIHLPPGTRIAVGREPRAASTAARLGEAEQSLSSMGGALALGVDEESHAHGVREVVVYLVGRRHRPALVEVVRVRGGTDEELDRAVALKAREVLDTVIRPAGDPGADTPPSSDMRRETEEAAPLLDPGLAIELSAFGATSSATADPQLGGVAALGLALEGDDWRAEALGFVRIPSMLSTSALAGDVEVTEVAAGGIARGLWLQRPLVVGVFVAAGARVLSAAGTTALGTLGAADRVVPFVALGPELGVTVAAWLRVRAALGVELPLARQRFALNHEPVLDLGPARGMAEVGLLATAF
jgi:hypothetical protein